MAKTIVYLIPGFPKDEEDRNCLPYIQDFILNISQFRKGNNVQIIAFQIPVRSSEYLWHGIPVYSAKGANRKGLFRLLTWYRAYRILKGIHKKSKIDVVHSFWLTECAWVGNVFNRFHAVKHVATIVGQDALPRNKYLKFLNWKRTSVIGVSEFVANSFYANTRNKVSTVIPFALNNSAGTSSNSAAGSFDILGVGNLHRLKNYALFIETIEIIARENPKIRAAIIGNAEERVFLLSEIESRHLEQNIVLPGELPREDVFAHMKKATVFLHTATFESQAYVLDEALFLGMQVVSTDVADVKLCSEISTGHDAISLAEQVNMALSAGRRNSTIRQGAEEAVAKHWSIYFSEN